MSRGMIVGPTHPSDFEGSGNVRFPVVGFGDRDRSPQDALPRRCIHYPGRTWLINFDWALQELLALGKAIAKGPKSVSLCRMPFDISW